MKNLLTFLSFFCLACLLFSFQNFNSRQQKTKPSGTVYYFEPAVSTLTGTLKAEVFYGPPGYGESPKTDIKETAYILHLSKPINVIATDPEDELNSTINNVTKIQLVSSGKFKLAGYNNKTVNAVGTLFSAHSGHHHTEVLLSLQNLNGIK